MTLDPGIKIEQWQGDRPDELAKVLSESFEGWYLRHAFHKLNEVGMVLVARKEGSVVGLTMLETLNKDTGYVFYIAVTPEARGKGIGSLLLDRALKYFRSIGCRRVYAAAENDNLASLKLFLSRGFRRTKFGEVSRLYGLPSAFDMYRRMVVVPGEVLLVADLGSVTNLAS